MHKVRMGGEAVTMTQAEYNRQWREKNMEHIRSYWKGYNARRRIAVRMRYLMARAGVPFEELRNLG